MGGGGGFLRRVVEERWVIDKRGVLMGGGGELLLNTHPSAPRRPLSSHSLMRLPALDNTELRVIIEH